jgi:hypothetical protein
VSGGYRVRPERVGPCSAFGVERLGWGWVGIFSADDLLSVGGSATVTDVAGGTGDRTRRSDMNTIAERIERNRIERTTISRMIAILIDADQKAATKPLRAEWDRLADESIALFRMGEKVRDGDRVTNADVDAFLSDYFAA